MVCPTCNAQTQNGEPCRRKTCKFAPKCFQHSQVRVAQSSIAGLGLFAKVPIRNNAIIGDYTVGTQRLTQNQFSRSAALGSESAAAVARAGHAVWSLRAAGCTPPSGSRRMASCTLVSSVSAHAGAECHTSTAKVASWAGWKVKGMRT